MTDYVTKIRTENGDMPIQATALTDSLNTAIENKMDSKIDTAVNALNLTINTALENVDNKINTALEELDAENITGQVAVANGGTGADNAADARKNLEITPANIGAAPMILYGTDDIVDGSAAPDDVPIGTLYVKIKSGDENV